MQRFVALCNHYIKRKPDSAAIATETGDGKSRCLFRSTRLHRAIINAAYLLSAHSGLLKQDVVLLMIQS